VNSISLKEGEEEFRHKAKLVQKYGAGVVVMAFDETGQATEVQDKVNISVRAFKILTSPEIGFLPEDIIFDLNILTIATGMKEHNTYGYNFVVASKLVK